MKTFEVITSSANKINIRADNFIIVDGLLKFYKGEGREEKLKDVFNMTFVERVREI